MPKREKVSQLAVRLALVSTFILALLGRSGLGPIAPLDAYCRSVTIGASHPLYVAVNALTDIGSHQVLICVVAAFALLFISRRQYESSFRLVVIAAASGIVTLLLKEMFQLERPGSPYAAVHTSGYSFPSGHALASAAILSTVAALTFERSRWIQRLSAALVCLISGSRVLLGAHYLSDVVAGVSLGWLLGLFYWRTFWSTWRRGGDK